MPCLAAITGQSLSCNCCPGIFYAEDICHFLFLPEKEKTQRTNIIRISKIHYFYQQALPLAGSYIFISLQTHHSYCNYEKFKVFICPG
ncbi:MAG: hypothetical protein R6U64_06675, partial [Bacteroidales bacterium]